MTAVQTETLRIRLDPELKRTIETTARLWGMSTSATVRRMIVGYCAGQSAPTKGEK